MNPLAQNLNNQLVDHCPNIKYAIKFRSINVLSKRHFISIC